METVKQVANRLGAETAISWADHRIECLEAEIRSNLQALRGLSAAVLAGDGHIAEATAEAVRNLLRAKAEKAPSPMSRTPLASRSEAR